MPKPKPDNIIRHEIVLGRSERELVDTLTTAYTVNRVASPVVELMSSKTGLLLVLGLLLSQLEKYLPPDWYDMTNSGIMDWFESQNIILGTLGFGLGGVIGGLLGIPFGPAGIVAGATAGATTGAVTGTVAAEGLEEFHERGLTDYIPIVYGARKLKELMDLAQESV
jgi:hypothetical protein